MSGHTDLAQPTWLHGLSERLSMPLPRRTRLLAELSYDIDELTDRLTADGLHPEEARRRAIEALVPDGETLAHLERLHATWYRRLSASVPDARLRRIERTVYSVAIALVLGVETTALLTVDVLRNASPFMWPLLGLGTALIALCIAKVFHLWIKGDHDHPRRGLGAIAGLSGASVLLALLGVLRDTILMAQTIEASPDVEAMLALSTLVSEASLLAVALLLALVGGLTWLVASQWILINEKAHQRALTSPTHSPREH